MLHNRITQQRRNLSLSQLQLAEKLKISPSAIGMYEQGRRTPDLQTLTAMSRLFRVSLDYLITGRDFDGAGSNTVNQIPGNCPCATCCWKEYRDK